jgi:predicted DNA-binding ribbon-helix-helix protein
MTYAGPQERRSVIYKAGPAKMRDAKGRPLREGAPLCRIFASQDPASYEPLTRALRINGHTTSLRLEAEFWAILDEIAAGEGLSTPRFISRLHQEVLERHGEVENFASMLRVTCALYLRIRHDRAIPARRAVEEIVT